MKLDLLALKQAPGKVFPLAGRVELPSITLGGEALVLKSGIDFTGEAVYQREVIYLSLNLSAEIERQCSRCLKSFTVPVNKMERLELREESASHSMKLDREEFTYSGDSSEIELLPYLKSLIISALNPKPLCREDCRGICPYCGKDLNEGSCNCQEEKVTDTRLEVLKELL